jgi:superfamily I DNA/RNA helicase
MWAPHLPPTKSVEYSSQNFIMNLNTQQQAVVNAIDGVWVVIAGPGSGKTASMIERYLNMLMKGISQKDILNLTFN